MHTPKSRITVAALWALAVYQGNALNCVLALDRRSDLDDATHNALIARVRLLADIQAHGVGDLQED